MRSHRAPVQPGWPLAKVVSLHVPDGIFSTWPAVSAWVNGLFGVRSAHEPVCRYSAQPAFSTEAPAACRLSHRIWKPFKCPTPGRPTRQTLERLHHRGEPGELRRFSGSRHRRPPGTDERRAQFPDSLTHAKEKSRVPAICARTWKASWSQLDQGTPTHQLPSLLIG